MKRLFFLNVLLRATALAADANDDLTLNWTNNLLTVSASALPGGKLEILYLEAF